MQIIRQFLKFGVVGIICFVIDFGIYTMLTLLGVHYLIAGTFGFGISVVVNYILSMRYVFENNSGYSKTKTFTIFVILSIIGFILNELLLLLFVNMFSSLFGDWIQISIIEIVSRLFAVGIVMIYNYVTRKLIYERPLKYSIDI